MPMKTMFETAREPSPRQQSIRRRREAGKIAEPFARDDELRDDLARS